MTKKLTSYLVLAFLATFDTSSFAQQTPAGRAQPALKGVVHVCDRARVVKKTYPVRGKTLLEAVNDSISNNPNHTGKPGETAWRYEYSLTEFETLAIQTGSNSYKATAIVTGAKVCATIVITTPAWEEADRASSEDQKTWHKLITDLEEHEEGHASDFDKGTYELQKAILGATGTGKGRTLTGAINTAISSAHQNAEENAQRIARSLCEKSAKRDTSEDKSVAASVLPADKQ